MPRPVCMKCSREMENVQPVVVQFNAHVTGGAYEQYHADLYRCPDCGAMIASGYGGVSWRHHGRLGDKEEPGVVVEERGFARPLSCR